MECSTATEKGTGSKAYQGITYLAQGGNLANWAYKTKECIFHITMMHMLNVYE